MNIAYRSIHNSEKQHHNNVNDQKIPLSQKSSNSNPTRELYTYLHTYIPRAPKNEGFLASKHIT